MPEHFARAVTTAAARACSACGCWPCTCRRQTEGPMEFPIRTETCPCGGRFTAGGGSDQVGLVIREHNQTARHQAWRKRKEEE